MGEYSYILEQQGKTTAEKLAEFTAAIGWRDELAPYRIAQDEYEMRTAAAAELGISLLDVPPYTAEELAALDAESAAYYEAFAANYIATAAFSGSGSGTQSDPYIITNRAELEAMADDLTAYYQLGNNIDISDAPWVIISSESAPFLGSLDGNGYVISGMYMSGTVPRRANIGLLGYGNQENTITDLGLENVDLSITSVDVAISPFGSNFGTIQRCWATGQVSWSGSGSSSQFAFASGLTSNTVNVVDCWSAVDISSTASTNKVGVAGLNTQAASVINTGSIQNSYYTGSIVQSGFSGESNRGLGGIAEPRGTDLTISASVMLGSISTSMSASYKGRVAAPINTPTLTNCFAADTITGYTPVGATTANGADVSASTYNTQAFWQNTLGWDFDTVWYWDDTANLPKLLVFRNGPTFPLNVEIGSPQYTTVSQINYSAGADASVQVTPATLGTTPVSNSYYTFQSQDGQHWMTAYVSKWTNNGGTWTADIIWSSSNTDSLPAQSICWCVWTKEYYQSIIDRISNL